MVRLGQHFLINKKYLRDIIQAADIQVGDFVIEIGPGKGILTQALLETGTKVTAIEKDKNLIVYLRQKFQRYIAESKLMLVEGDVLSIIFNFQFLIFDQFSISNFQTPAQQLIKWKLVGNIPYYITGKLIRAITEIKNPPDIAVFMLQREVTERITAQPPHMNQLAAIVQLFYESKIIHTVPPTAFKPIPKVDSAIILLNRKTSRSYRGLSTATPSEQTATNSAEIIQLIKSGFKQPRKTLFNNLTAKQALRRAKTELIFQKFGWNMKKRAQELSLEEWEKLSVELKKPA